MFVDTYKNASNRTVSWHYGGARLTANLALWLCMQITAAAASAWLQRRYPPRLRFSLRGMLAAVALIAAFCAWFVAARKRAEVQEPLIAEITARGGSVMFQRHGPRWLDLFGVDPLRRRIIGLEFTTNFGISEEEYASEEAFLKRIERLPDLQYLFVESDHATPGLAAALGKLRRLRALSIELFHDPEDQSAADACLEAIARMPDLENLYLQSFLIKSDQIAALDGLAQLKWLSLNFSYRLDSEPTLLSRLPALLRLETLDLSGTDISDRGLRPLAALPRLKSLNLQSTDVSDGGLAKLASLRSLEELQIESQWASPAGLTSLTALKQLKKLHVESNYWGSPKEAETPPEQNNGGSEGYFGGRGSEKLAKLQLDHGDEVSVPESERDACLKAIQTLRREMRGLVIDSDDTAISSYFSKYELWHARDTTIGRRAAWLPLSDYPWGGPVAMPSATRAECEAYAEKLGVPTSF